jgi:DNA-binding Xre family transcriptional regulator
MTIGEKIDIVLQQKDLNNRQAAKMLGLRENLLSMYKYDARPMPLKTFIKFCKTFDVDANWLIGKDE